MKIVRITFLSCLAAVWIVACGQNTAEPPSPDPVDSWYDDIDNYHHSPFVLAVWKVLGKNPLKATKGELARVTRLPRIWRGPFIPQRGIDLLAACVNLVELEIAFITVSNEQLAVLGGLTKLESLKLLQNGISDLSPLAGLVNLWHLDLTGNEIEDLSPLAGLVNLRHLDLSGNQIEDLSPLAGLVQLQYLYLSSNEIEDLSPLAGLVDLPHLNLSSNQIEDLSPLAGLINLQRLNLSSNQIEDLSPLAGLVNLRHLHLSSNQIDDLSPLAGLVQLETLNLTNNKIVDIQPLLDNVGIGAGDSIHLQRNKLSDISRNQHVPALEARGVIVVR